MLVREDGISRGVRTRRIRVLDYYTVPWEDKPAGTPPAVMFVARELATGREHMSAWHLLAESQGIPPSQIRKRQAELERALLQELALHLGEDPKARWVHWGLNKVEYGFPALTQRGRALGLGELAFPSARLLDLSELLKWQFGEGYVGHPRLANLLRLNQIQPSALLGPAELAAAYHARDFRRMLKSLLCKVKCLTRILELYLAERLRTDATDPRPLALPRVRKLRWISTVRDALANGPHGGPEEWARGKAVAVARPSAAKFVPFVPTELQQEILKLLKGKALTLEALAHNMQTDSGSLHRRGLRGLMDVGWVLNDRRVGGYYLPDDPPPAFAPYLAGQAAHAQSDATEVPPKRQRRASAARTRSNVA